MGQGTVPSPGPLQNPAYWVNLVQNDFEGKGISEFNGLTPWTKKNTLPRKGGRGWELRGGEASGSPWFFLFSQGPWMMFLSPRDLRKEREEWEEAGKTWTGNHWHARGQEVDCLSSLCWQEKLGRKAPQEKVQLTPPLLWIQPTGFPTCEYTAYLNPETTARKLLWASWGHQGESKPQVSSLMPGCFLHFWDHGTTWTRPWTKTKDYGEHFEVRIHIPLVFNGQCWAECIAHSEWSVNLYTSLNYWKTCIEVVGKLLKNMVTYYW